MLWYCSGLLGYRVTGVWVRTHRRRLIFAPGVDDSEQLIGTVSYILAVFQQLEPREARDERFARCTLASVKAPEYAAWY